MRNPLRLAGLLPVLWVSVFWVLSVGAGVAGEAATPVSTTDPQIPVAELELRLQPLTVDELQVEAQGWLDLLKAKVEELSNAEIAVKYKNLEIETAEQVQEAKEQAAGTQRGEELKEAAQAAREAEQKAKQDQAVQEATTEALKEAQHKPTEQGTDQARPSDTGDKPVAEKEDTKAKLLEHINTLRAERTALMDRLNAVVSAWEAKGGDQETIEQYQNRDIPFTGLTPTCCVLALVL
jgi:small conductance mechanosensitive channel